jgi:hypothetical protein
MRHLIPHFDPTLWSTVSAAVFFVAFAVLIFWVFLPSRRTSYEENAKIPLTE